MKRTLIPALVITILIIGWLASGMINQSQSTATSFAPPIAEREEQRSATRRDGVTRVRAQLLSATSQTVATSVRGYTKASRTVNVQAEIKGRIAELPLVRGSSVKKGDVLCRLLEGDRKARLEEAVASVEQAQIEYDGALSLESSGLQSKMNKATAKARLATQKANLKQRSLDFDYLTITAPFDGILERLPVEIGDYLQSGSVCASIVDLNPIVLTGQVAERNVMHLKSGMPAQATLLNGETLDGVVRFISKDASTQTRTYEIEVEASNPNLRIPAGLTVDIEIPTAVYLAHLISPALLALGDEGEIGVRILDDSNKVAFQPVHIVKDDARGIWVSGLPQLAKVITVGQELAVEGEEVEVDLESTEDIPATLFNQSTNATSNKRVVTSEKKDGEA